MRRADPWRPLLWAILAAAAAWSVFLSIPSGDQREQQTSPLSTQSSRTEIDSLQAAIINELLEGWGKCEMEKHGHIVFPSDTAVRLL